MEMRGTCLRAQTQRGRTGSQAVHALQTEPIVCRRASNGPCSWSTKSTAASAGSPGPSAPRRAAMTAGALPCFALHNTHPRFGASLLKPHSHNCIKLQNICTLTPAQMRARHPTAAAASVLLATPNARSRRPRKLQTCTKADR